MSQGAKTPFLYSGTELEALGEADNYYRWILTHFRPYLGPRVVEVGAGIGTFSNHLLDDGRVRELVALEPADNLFPLLERRLSGDPRVKVEQGYLEDLAGSLSADAVILVNVLEHSADDEALLRAVHRVLVAGGHILLFVPAVAWLFGSLDEAFEHHRRYTKPRLGEALERTGFRVESLRYINFPGVFSWFLAGKVLRRKTLNPRDVRLYDRWVVPWAAWLERRWEPPVGQSLVAVGTKRNEAP